MKKLSLIVCSALILIISGCGKKEPAPTPQPQAEAPKPAPAAAPAVETPAPAPAPAQAAKPARKVKAPPGEYTVQVASWETKDEAEKLVEFFKGKGFEARLEEADLSSGRWYRVRIGHYDNYSSASEAANQIEEKYKSQVWLVKL
jgi:cell division protein FtsN